MKKILLNIGVVSGCLVFSAIHSQVQAQTRTIAGTVNNGEKPISGVVVTQEGTNHLTTTTATGAFSFQITGENPVLIFRHPEYGERKILTDGKTNFTISLTEKVKSIEEVVLNAGYYNVKAKESTGSISKVTAKDIENQPVTNVLSAVQGRMAGVSIVQNSGVPGGGYDVQIRGRNSLRTVSNSEINGNTPLYIIDGVPISSETRSFSGVTLPGGTINPLNSISPNDIASIEVLKDADATAIYGSRGANGVILVTTKRSRKGPVTLGFNTSYVLSRTLSNLEMMDTEQYLSMRRLAFSNGGITTYPANAYDVNGTWDAARYTDWRKILIGNTAASSSTQLSVGAGGANTGFLLSLGHSAQGTAFGRDFRYTATTLSNSLDHLSEDSRFRINMTNLLSLQKNNLVRTNSTAAAYTLSPNAPALSSADGSLNWQNNTFTNPVAAYESTYGNEQKQLLTNISAQYRLFPKVMVKLNGGLNYQTLEEMTLQPHTMYNPSTANGLSSATSRAAQNRSDRFSLTLEPQLEWKYRRGLHEMEVLAGAAYQMETGSHSTISGIGFESNAFIENIGAATTKTVSDIIDTDYRYAAVFGRVNYRVADRYLMNITGRRDGSSRFGPNKKYAAFGAVGAGWIFSKESFLKDSSWLSFGKVRASFGTAGSDNIGDNQYLDTYTVSTLVYNGVTGLMPSRLYNPDYSWEKTAKLEAALELSFFKDRLEISAAWYRNRSSNQLVGYQLPTMTGFASVLANIDATVENSGLELELSARVLAFWGVRWETSLNGSFPRSKLLSFPSLEGSTYANSYVIGQPTGIIKLYQLEGIDPQTGMYRFTDFNGDGKITSPEDNKVIENTGVKFFGGWQNTLRYQDWDFSFLFQFVSQRNRNYNSVMTVPGSMNNQPVEVLDVWSAANPAGTYMQYTAGANASHNLFRNSTASVSDASFVRLKNVQLSYRIPLRDNAFRDVKVYVQGQNLLTFTKYFGIDPEFTFMGFLPPLRTFAFGLQFNL